MLERYLQDLEDRIDPAEEESLLQSWLDFAYGRCQTLVFAPRRSRLNPPNLEWPSIPINVALDDFDAMALQQFGSCSAALAEASGLLLNVRCNYGTAIMPSLFGAAVFVMDQALNTLPTCRPFGAAEAIQRLVDAGPPDLHAGYGGRVLAMGERFVEIARRYPKIGKYIFIYHPDLQGPMDICELLWGSAIFYALVDQPDLVHALLGLAAETYVRMMRAWSAIVPFHARGNAHWGFFHRGSLMLRDDSAMNLSGVMVNEFVLPYDQRLLDEFGGGAIHFCGKGDHFIASMSGLRGLYAVNCSQPDWNDMNRVYFHTVDKGINLLGLDSESAQAAHASGRSLHGRVHVVT
jgi:hypothetical protein